MAITYFKSRWKSVEHTTPLTKLVCRERHGAFYLPLSRDLGLMTFGLLWWWEMGLSFRCTPPSLLICSTSARIVVILLLEGIDSLCVLSIVFSSAANLLLRSRSCCDLEFFSMRLFFWLSYSYHIFVSYLQVFLINHNISTLQKLYNYY